MNELAKNLLAAGGLVPCGGSGQDPCAYLDLFILIGNVIQFILYLAVPVATIAIVAAGIMLAASAKRESQRSDAKKILWSAMIGLFLTFAAYLIINAIITGLGSSVVQGILE